MSLASYKAGYDYTTKMAANKEPVYSHGNVPQQPPVVNNLVTTTAAPTTPPQMFNTTPPPVNSTPTPSIPSSGQYWSTDGYDPRDVPSPSPTMTSGNTTNQQKPATQPIVGTTTTPMMPQTPLGFATTPGMPSPNASYTANMTPQELVSYQMEQLLNSRSPYMLNAQRRGLETAASRGLLNSSIASGASTRSAIEAALPIASQDAASNLNVQNQNRQFQFGEASAQNQMSRQDWLNAAQTGREYQYRDALANNDTYRNNWLTAQQTQRDYQFRDALATNEAYRSDWLNNNSFQRQFNANLSLMPITSSFDFFNRAMQMALEDPSVYTPEVVNGLSQFNMSNLNNILQQYLGTGSSGTGTGGGP